MTENYTITDAELQAIRSVDCHIRTIAHSDAFRPPEPVLEDIQQVGRLVKRLCTAPPIEEVASRPNGEFAVPDAQDDFDKVQWQILYGLLQSANHPDEVKRFVDDALKVKDANLLRAALRALDSYDMPDIPF